MPNNLIHGHAENDIIIELLFFEDNLNYKQDSFNL